MLIKFTPSARTQFLDGISNIKQDNPIAAQNFRQHAEEVLRRLIDFPDSGKAIREFPDLPFREVVVAPYRFFYRVKEDVIWIVSVWHSAQQAGLPEADLKNI